MVERVLELTGRRSLLFYTGYWYWQAWALDLDDEQIAALLLWLSNYPSSRRMGTEYEAAVAALPSGVKGPKVPKPWESRKKREALWQFDGDGGLVLPNPEATDADFNIFYGSYAKLDALVASTLKSRDSISPHALSETPIEVPSRDDMLVAIARTVASPEHTGIPEGASSGATTIRAGEGKHNPIDGTDELP
jgi:hypothetical protein